MLYYLCIHTFSVNSKAKMWIYSNACNQSRNYYSKESHVNRWCCPAVLDVNGSSSGPKVVAACYQILVLIHVFCPYSFLLCLPFGFTLLVRWLGTMISMLCAKDY